MNCQLGDRTAVVRVRCSTLEAAGRAARRSLATSIHRAGRDHELGQFIQDAAFQKGRSIVFKFRKAPENR